MSQGRARRGANFPMHKRLRSPRSGCSAWDRNIVGGYKEHSAITDLLRSLPLCWIKTYDDYVVKCYIISPRANGNPPFRSTFKGYKLFSWLLARIQAYSLTSPPLDESSRRCGSWKGIWLLQFPTNSLSPATACCSLSRWPGMRHEVDIIIYSGN